MQNLRLLITSAFEALLGESFPRRVTAVNGKTRWLGYSGRSFETREEALRNERLIMFGWCAPRNWPEMAVSGRSVYVCFRPFLP
jgi:hypothetical protein